MEPWEFHPSLVHFPIALLIAAVVYDLYAWRRGDPGASRVATGLLVAGVGTAALAAAAGVLAFFTGPASYTEEAGHLIWWHIGAAVTMFLLFTIAAIVRWRTLATPPAWTRVAGLIATAVLVYAGYVGGYIVYHGASGIEPHLLAPPLQAKQIEKQNKDHSGGQKTARMPVPTAPRRG